MLVDGLTKLVHLNIEDKEEAEIENLRKMFLAMSKDIRVIFIKLCDRLHNMRTLYAKPEQKRRITALETMHVFAPLAHRLGMQRIKQELEQLALSYLDPIGFEEVRRDIDRKYGQNRDFIGKTKENVAERLKEYGIKFTLEGRVKSVYSIYKKMYNQNKSFDEIYDFYAIRIIVDTEIECYTVLGIYFDAEAEHVQVAPYDSYRTRRHPVRGPDPHVGDAPHRRIRYLCALEVQIRRDKPGGN